MKIGCIIQARTTSSRLPGKVLRTIDFETKQTILEEVIRRVKLSNKIDKIIIATTKNRSDDEIVEIAKRENIGWYRGSEEDVLSRFYYAAEENALDYIIRITSDCPFIDPHVIDDLIELYKEGNYDYASNCINRTFPHGLDCEMFSFEAFKKVKVIAKDKYYREHVTSYFYLNPQEYKIGSLELLNENYSDIRVTVDTKQDYATACVLKSYLCEGMESYKDIVKIYMEKPYIKIINDNILQKKQYASVIEECKDAINLLELQELNEAADIIRKKINNEIDR